MAKKRTNKPRPQVKAIKKEVEQPIKEIQKEPEIKYNYRVKKDLGFKTGKRNYYCETVNKNILLVEGEGVTDEVYGFFNSRAQELFFDKI